MAQPNILIIMVDQLNGTLFPDGPADCLHAPNLKRLAARSARFANTYNASPLCAPARASFMSGQLPSKTRVYDNAAEFASDIPTYAHHLRRAGYYTALSGKMHFVGPDQLHGFEERFTTDIYPADFGWTPDYRKPGERIDWWYHNMGSVTGSGVGEISNQMEYDDEVAHHGVAKIYDLARGPGANAGGGRPWCLTVSFTHPHDPYVARRKYWDLYADCEHLMPTVGPMAFEDHDPQSQRILQANDYGNYNVTDEDVRRSRQAYFANISYIDDKVGQLLEALETSQQADDTVVIFLSDHGDMLGERGLWFKMSFFEGSSRVPLMIAAPEGLGRFSPGRVDVPVSSIDLAPTLAALADADMADVMPWTEGVDLAPVAASGARSPVAMEYAAEGTYAPIVALVADHEVTAGERRCFKFTCSATLPDGGTDPEQLFDLTSDPDELTNLAIDPAHADVLAHFRGLASERWDLDRFDEEVRQSQARRLVTYDALRKGDYYPWDFQPLQKASERYMRNHMDLNVLETAKRAP
ncbi:MAG: choline-sulfatase [Pseudomonadota bacterium]